MQFNIIGMPLNLIPTYGNKRGCRKLTFYFETAIFSILGDRGTLLRFQRYEDGSSRSRELTMGDYNWFLTALERFGIEIHALQVEPEIMEHVIEGIIPKRLSYTYSELRVQKVEASCGAESYVVKFEAMREPMRKFLSEDHSFISWINQLDRYKLIKLPRHLTKDDIEVLINTECSLLQLNCFPHSTIRTYSSRPFTSEMPLNASNRIATATLSIGGEDSLKNLQLCFFLVLLVPVLLFVWVFRRYKKCNKNTNTTRGEGEVDKCFTPLLQVSAARQQLNSFNDFQRLHAEHIIALLKGLNSILCRLRIAKKPGFDRLYKDVLNDAIQCFELRLETDNLASCANECTGHLKKLISQLNRSDTVGEGQHFQKHCRDFLLLVVENLIRSLSLLMLQRLNGERLYISLNVIDSIARKISELRGILFQFLSRDKSMDQLLEISAFYSACTFCFDGTLDAHAFAYYCYMQRSDVNGVVFNESTRETEDAFLREKLMALLRIGLNVADTITKECSQGRRGIKLYELAKSLNDLQQISNFVQDKNGREQGIAEERKRYLRQDRRKAQTTMWRYSAPSLGKSCNEDWLEHTVETCSSPLKIRTTF